jgi:hypothetical protein
MGKSKKGAYPPQQPKIRYIEVEGGEIEDSIVIAWGDSVVWQNKDNVPYTLIALAINGQAIAGVPPVWANLTAVNTVGADSSPRVYGWPGVPPKDPYVYQYGMKDPPNAKATLTVQISVPEISV